jgi:c-di-GMP-binding flagellar brake protein YcgR
MADERRIDPRIKCDARVDYGSPDEVILDHQVENLSIGGACLSVVSGQPLGTRVVLFLSFPGFNSDTYEVEGEVVWSNDVEPRDIGIRFLNLDGRAQEALKRYIATHLSG